MSSEKRNLQSPDFKIKDTGPVSRAFIERGISDFSDAAQFIMHLPYGRNEDKDNLLSVFTDGCGTCSTKHALLRLLAAENNFNDLKLYIGIFRMHSLNTPEVVSIFGQHDLHFIPEAHNYLRYNGKLLDFTKPGFKLAADESDLLKEIEVNPDQVNLFKIAFHKNFLKDWLVAHQNIPYAFEELWAIREKCIYALANN